MTRILILAAATVTLTAAVALEAAFVLTAPSDAMPSRRAAVEITGHVMPSAPDEPAAAWMATALERPLFRENRRPAKSIDIGNPADGPARLTGVMTGPFGKRAIFTSPNEARPIVVIEGGRVADFVVRSIGPGQAIIEADGSMRTLRPAFAGNPSNRN
jgi:hypothetical protein